MPIHASQTLSIDIDCPLERAYAFVSNPENLPQWAAGLGGDIRPDGDQWIIDTPGGPAALRFADRNVFGVLDHTVHPPGGGEVYVPMRMVANGDGCRVMLTLFRSSDVSEDRFNRDVEFVKNDLTTLRKLLEA